MVLVGVMWATLFVSMIGGALLILSTSSRRAHAIELDQTQAEFLAKAAIEELGGYVVRYFGLPPDQRPVELGEDLVQQGVVGRETLMGPGMVRLSLQDESGKMNVNLATETALEGLCSALACANPSGVAKALVKWRTTQRPFFRVGEIASLSEVTPEILAVLSPYLSVHTDGKVNPNTAHEAVLNGAVQELKRIELSKQRDASGSKPPPEVATLIGGRPWTSKKMMEELGQWAGYFSVQSRTFHVEAAASIRGRTATLHRVGDILRMTTGEPASAEWVVLTVGPMGKSQ